MIHPLEPRRLLDGLIFSTSVDFEPDTGLLLVRGSGGPDVIELSLQNDSANETGTRLAGPADPQMGTRVTVHDGQVLIYSEFFEEGSLSRIELIGDDGADSIRVLDDAGLVPITVLGDDGGDEIEVVVSGIDWASVLAPRVQVFGGAGADLIRVTAGKYANRGFLVFGEDGDDTIFGSDRDDELYGDSDDLREHYFEGNDVIYAGAGDDLVFGGPGDDLLYGQEGNDWLVGGLGSDILDGGAGDDTAVWDLLDKMVVDIEFLMKPA